MANVPAAFKIIIHDFSDKPFQYKKEIYNCVLDIFNAYKDQGILPEHGPILNFTCADRASRYLKDFGVLPP